MSRFTSRVLSDDSLGLDPSASSFFKKFRENHQELPSAASNDLFHPEQPLDLQVYLTTKGAILGRTAHLPFVHHNRPDVKEIFLKMREDALARGEKRIAVCVCAPARLVVICQKACAKYSDRKVRFDLHVEVFG